MFVCLCACLCPITKVTFIKKPVVFMGLLATSYSCAHPAIGGGGHRGRPGDGTGGGAEAMAAVAAVVGYEGIDREPYGNDGYNGFNGC